MTDLVTLQTGACVCALFKTQKKAANFHHFPPPFSPLSPFLRKSAPPLQFSDPLWEPTRSQLLLLLLLLLPPSCPQTWFVSPLRPILFVRFSGKRWRSGLESDMMTRYTYDGFEISSPPTNVYAHCPTHKEEIQCKIVGKYRNKY